LQVVIFEENSLSEKKLRRFGECTVKLSQRHLTQPDVAWFPVRAELSRPLSASLPPVGSFLLRHSV
jgi:hypothetical protein